MRILIADDDDTSRTMLAGVLGKYGYEVESVPGGDEAWRRLKVKDAPKLVILDWMMPGMDGLEVLRRIRKREDGETFYILLLTSRDEKKDIVEGLDAGANDYLPKPFNPGELRARVEVGRRMISMQETLARKIEELRKAIEKIRTLRGIIPICAGCKKIRNDQGYWQQVEVYVKNHSDAEFSHGLCPECLTVMYPDLDLEADDDT
jgi:CheY-like chemotaxis protein